MSLPPKTKIFVGKLPPTCQEHELRKLFETYGDVTECSLMGSYAFVHMKTEEQASSAIQELNNYDLQGFKISVEQSTGERKSGGMRGGPRGGRGGFRGRGGRGMGFRPSPYDRRPPHPMDSRYGPPGPPMRNGYFDEYERRERRPLPPPMDRRPMSMERRPPPPPHMREGYRDIYDRYDGYERMPPPPPMRRTPPMERRLPPIGYDRREEHYGMYSRPETSLYGRDPYAPRDRSPRSPPRRYPGHAPRGEMPPRRF